MRHGRPARGNAPGQARHSGDREPERIGDVRGMRNIRKAEKGGPMGSVIKKRRKRMAKKKHRKLLKKTRVQRRNKK